MVSSVEKSSMKMISRFGYPQFSTERIVCSIVSDSLRPWITTETSGQRRNSRFCTGGAQKPGRRTSSVQIVSTGSWKRTSGETTRSQM